MAGSLTGGVSVTRARVSSDLSSLKPSAASFDRIDGPKRPVFHPPFLCDVDRRDGSEGRMGAMIAFSARATR